MSQSLIYTLNPGIKKDNLVYVPSIGLYITRERTLFNRNWYQAHKELSKQRLRMPTIPEFVEFLKYTRDNDQDVYEDITAVRNPLRGEWLDAYFEKRSNGILRGSESYILTNITSNRTKEEKLDKDTLMKNKQPGIRLEDWLDNPNSQGLPKTDIKEGSLYYWYPRDGGVARFLAYSGRADFDCDRSLQVSNSGLGVRAVVDPRHVEKKIEFITI